MPFSAVRPGRQEDVNGCSRRGHLVARGPGRARRAEAGRRRAADALERQLARGVAALRGAAAEVDGSRRFDPQIEVSRSIGPDLDRADARRRVRRQRRPVAANGKTRRERRRQRQHLGRSIGLEPHLLPRRQRAALDAHVERTDRLPGVGPTTIDVAPNVRPLSKVLIAPSAGTSADAPPAITTVGIPVSAFPDRL